MPRIRKDNNHEIKKTYNEEDNINSNIKYLQQQINEFKIGNIDGGNADSDYTTEQIIDGGSA